jgi:hypothetical protein
MPRLHAIIYQKLKQFHTGLFITILAFLRSLSKFALVGFP